MRAVYAFSRLLFTLCARQKLFIFTIQAETNCYIRHYDGCRVAAPLSFNKSASRHFKNVIMHCSLSQPHCCHSIAHMRAAAIISRASRWWEALRHVNTDGIYDKSRFSWWVATYYTSLVFSLTRQASWHLIVAAPLLWIRRGLWAVIIFLVCFGENLPPVAFSLLRPSLLFFSSQLGLLHW